MGTRSAIGFHVNGKDVLMYNQLDGYPTYMGKRVFKDALRLKKRHGWKKLRDMVTTLRQVRPSSDPTNVDQVKYKKYFEFVNGGQGYYALLRELQGNLHEVIKAGIICADNEFIKDSLMCEWAYIINLDTKQLEIYKGFRTTKPIGRYSNVEPDGKYYACSLIKTINLSNGAEVMAVILSGDAFWQQLRDSDSEGDE